MESTTLLDLSTIQTNKMLSVIKKSTCMVEGDLRALCKRSQTLAISWPVIAVHADSACLLADWQIQTALMW